MAREVNALPGCRVSPDASRCLPHCPCCNTAASPRMPNPQSLHERPRNRTLQMQKERALPSHRVQPGPGSLRRPLEAAPVWACAGSWGLSSSLSSCPFLLLTQAWINAASTPGFPVTLCALHSLNPLTPGPLWGFSGSRVHMNHPGILLEADSESVGGEWVRESASLRRPGPGAARLVASLPLRLTALDFRCALNVAPNPETKMKWK